MSETNSMMPELTLNAEASQVEAPQLVLGTEPAAPAVEEKKAEPVKIDESMLTPAERKMVDDFSKKIDITDSQMVLQYGAAAQKNIASFSENALKNVRTKDLGDVGDTLSELVVELKGFGEEEEKGFFGFFKKASNKLETMKAQYGKAEANVEKIARELEQHQVVLMKDIAMFDQMYELNLKYYKELTMYIIAGKKRLAEVKATQLEELRKKAETNVDKIVKILEGHQIVLMKDIALFDQMYDLNTKYYKELTMYIIAGKKRLAAAREGELEQLRLKAEQSGSQEDAQAYNDFANLCTRFEKKLHDLELTRMISIQMGPQTRLLQNNDTQMLEKIQSSLMNIIPLWKSQMVLALGLEHGRQATAAQTAVTDMTNELLKKNADMLKMGTVATAREAERSIVSIETLQHTNQQLIATLDEVMQIQNEGRAQRKSAEAELGRIEGELKQKLLELRG